MNDEDTMQSASPTIVGRYHLARRIGRGGMGEVWLGEDPRLHRQVAIKTLPLRSQNDREFLQRFEREARAAAALNHPHILPVHDYGEQALPNGQSITYIVMPYVSGGTLAGRLATLTADDRLLPPGEAINYLSQVAQAIDYAHGQNVLHRDVKPSNMLLRSDGWLLLADFGIARILSDQAMLTQTGVGIGTPEYMAPEQAQGKAEAASDNYSLAVIAYQIFTGQLPFRAETPYAITVQHIISPPPPPRQANPNLSVAVERALLHGLAKEPAQRPPTASAFVAELQSALTDPSYAATLIAQPFLSTGDTVTIPSSSRIGTGGDASAAPQLPTTPVPTEVSPAAPPTSKGITRRSVLIGGGAALLAAGGLGAWEIASRHTSSSPTIVHNTKPAPNPNAPVLTLLAHTQPISSLAWSPVAANMLVSAGKDSQVMLWDIPAITRGQASKTAPQAKQQFNSSTVSPVLLAWSADGSAIAIANANFTLEASGKAIDMKMQIYKNDLSAPEPYYNELLMTFLRTAYVSAVSWGPGKYITAITRPVELAGKTTYRLEFRDPLDSKLGFRTILEYGFGYSVAVSPADKSTVAMGIYDGVLIAQPLITANTTQWKTTPVTLTFDSTQPAASDVTWSPDGRYVAAITNPILIPKYTTSQLAVWNASGGDSTRLSLSLPNASTILAHVAWSPAPTSTQLAAGSKDGAVYIWNVNPGNLKGNALPTRSLIGLAGAEVTALAWSADGQWLAAGYNDTNDSVLIWKL
jgi:eukaryotic-like serine/threonine-protein kinase